MLSDSDPWLHIDRRNLSSILCKLNKNIDNIKNLSDVELQTYFDNVIDYKPVVKKIIYNRRLDLLQRVNIIDFDIRFENDILLGIAAMASDVASVEYFIDQGLDVTSKDNFIIRHCGYSSEVLELIISNGADVNAGNGAALIYCVMHSLVENVKVLINNGADYSLQNYAALTKIASEDILLLFIDAGIDCNIDNGSILKEFIYTFDYTLIKILLEHGAEVKYLQSDNLWYILNKKSPDANRIIKLLIDYGLNFNKITLIDDKYDLLSKYVDSIYIAYIIHDLRYHTENKVTMPNLPDLGELLFIPSQSSQSSIEIIKSMVKIGDFDDVKKYLDYNDRDILLKTLIYNNEFDLFKLLLNLYTDIKIDNNFLTVAVRIQNIEAIKYLLDMGLDIHYNNIAAVLMACAVDKQGIILELFIEYGLQINNDFLVVAAFTDNLKCIEILINNGADMYYSDGLVLSYSIVNSKIYGLMGVEYNTCDTLVYYIKCGVDVNYGKGMLLTAAIKNGYYEKIKILLENGVDVSYVNNVIDIVKCNDEIIKLLVEYGADFSTLNMYEVSETGQEFVEMLLNNGIEKANICKLFL